jgi:hypothetical protein
MFSEERMHGSRCLLSVIYPRKFQRGKGIRSLLTWKSKHLSQRPPIRPDPKPPHRDGHESGFVVSLLLFRYCSQLGFVNLIGGVCKIHSKARASSYSSPQTRSTRFVLQSIYLPLYLGSFFHVFITKYCWSCCRVSFVEWITEGLSRRE